jgi:hypothetical protein
VRQEDRNMSYCPSKDWDRYYRDQELPEECPVCKKENADPETGDWIYKTGPYCSAECEKKDQERLKEEAEAEARQYEEEKKMILDYNSKCEKCRGNDLQVCFHRDYE